MARIEVHIVTTVREPSGELKAFTDPVMCFVEDDYDKDIVEERAISLLDNHCMKFSKIYDVMYCTATVFIRGQSMMSLSHLNKELPDNIVPLHSPDRSP
jgi:hypothetical protein